MSVWVLNWILYHQRVWCHRGMQAAEIKCASLKRRCHHDHVWICQKRELLSGLSPETPHGRIWCAHRRLSANGWGELCLSFPSQQYMCLSVGTTGAWIAILHFWFYLPSLHHVRWDTCVFVFKQLEKNLCSGTIRTLWSRLWLHFAYICVYISRSIICSVDQNKWLCLEGI